MTISEARRTDIIGAIRNGTVPRAGLDQLAVGLSPFEGAFDEELTRARTGSGVFKCVRGEYGSGKTFITRWLSERAKQEGFATAEVQISETETPLHRLETVYRRIVERLSTSTVPNGALRTVLDSWFYHLEEDILEKGEIDEDDNDALIAATNELAERRLGDITREAPMFSAVLRGYRDAVARGDGATADGLIAWLGGQPNVAAGVKRQAGIKGDLDHFGALSFLQALLVVLKDAGHPGLLVVLDEVETLQRVRSDVRDKGLNALRQLVDEVDSGRFPGLYLVITGTPAFYDGNQGVQRAEALASRLATDFNPNPKFDNPRAIQIRLSGFSLESLTEVGVRVRDLYADGSTNTDRIREKVDDAYIQGLARAVTGGLGGNVGVAPRLFLKKLVGGVLDVVDLHADFNPREDYVLKVSDSELTVEESAAAANQSMDDIELEL